MGIKLANYVSTTLSAGIDAVATTLFVTSTVGIPELLKSVCLKLSLLKGACCE